MATYIVNTDAASNEGASLHDEWLRRSIAATGGDRRYRDALARIQKDDSVLMYVNGVGVVARGVAEDDGVVDATGDQLVNQAEPIEYHKPVRWDLDLRDKPVPPTELRSILGQTPIQAVQRVVKGEARLAQRLSELEAMPTADSRECVRLAEKLLSRGPITRPLGVMTPARANATSTQFFRDPKVHAWSIQRAKGRCELCGQNAPFHKDGGLPYLESHHIVPLAEGGPDTPANAAAVCPNCHRELHSGEARASKREALRSLISAKEAAGPNGPS